MRPRHTKPSLRIILSLIAFAFANSACGMLPEGNPAHLLDFIRWIPFATSEFSKEGFAFSIGYTKLGKGAEMREVAEGLYPWNIFTPHNPSNTESCTIYKQSIYETYSPNIEASFYTFGCNRANAIKNMLDKSNP